MSHSRKSKNDILFCIVCAVLTIALAILFFLFPELPGKERIMLLGAIVLLFVLFITKLVAIIKYRRHHRHHHHHHHYSSPSASIQRPQSNRSNAESEAN